MNKWLLIWNIVLTIFISGMIVSGCSSIDPQFAYMDERIKSNRAAIEKLAEGINENKQLIQNQTTQSLALRMTVEASLTQLKTSLEQYIQEYVAAH